MQAPPILDGALTVYFSLMKNNSYKTGINAKVNNVDEVNPPITVKAQPFQDDVVNASGINTAIVAKTIIKIGLSRVFPDLIKDSRRVNSFSSRFFVIRSVKTIAFVTTILMDNGSLLLFSSKL